MHCLATIRSVTERRTGRQTDRKTYDIIIPIADQTATLR